MDHLEGSYVKVSTKKIPFSNDPNNTFWKEDKSKFGYKLLMKMGWSEGKGLGKKEDGMQEPIKALELKSKLGLAAEGDTSRNWLINNGVYNNLLANLVAKYGILQKKDESEEENSSPKKKPKHLISAGKRHKAKLVNNYSKEDLAAILGKDKESLETISSQIKKKRSHKILDEEHVNVAPEFEKKKEKRKKQKKYTEEEKNQKKIKEEVISIIDDVYLTKEQNETTVIEKKIKKSKKNRTKF